MALLMRLTLRAGTAFGAVVISALNHSLRGGPVIAPGTDSTPR